MFEVSEILNYSCGEFKLRIIVNILIDDDL